MNENLLIVSVVFQIFILKENISDVFIEKMFRCEGQYPCDFHLTITNQHQAAHPTGKDKAQTEPKGDKTSPCSQQDANPETHRN